MARSLCIRPLASLACAYRVRPASRSSRTAPSARRRWRARLLASVAAFLCVTSALADPADISSTWAGGSGSWADPTKWVNVPAVPQFSNNQTGSLAFSALINSPDPAYTVSLSNDVTVNSFTLDSPAATLEHSAKTFLVNGPFHLASGTYHLSGGKITNSTITADAGELVVKSGTLDHVTLAADLTFNEQSSSLLVKDGLTLQDSTIRFLHGGSMDFFQGTQTLSGTGQIIFENDLDTDHNVVGPHDSTLTIGPGITIRTGNPAGTFSKPELGYVGSYDDNLTNEGTISSQTPDRVLWVAGKTLINRGLLRATNGGKLTLNGTIPVNGLGSFDSTGGTVALCGTLQNTGNTLALSGIANTLTLTGGQITGGIITGADGARIVGTSGTLDGLTLAAEMLLPDGAVVWIKNDLTLQDNAVRMAADRRVTDLMAGGCTIGGTDQVVFDGTIRNYVEASIIGSGEMVRTGTGSGTVGFVCNKGDISAQTPRQTIVITGPK